MDKSMLPLTLKSNSNENYNRNISKVQIQKTMQNKTEFMSSLHRIYL